MNWYRQSSRRNKYENVSRTIAKGVIEMIKKDMKSGSWIARYQDTDIEKELNNVSQVRNVEFVYTVDDSDDTKEDLELNKRPFSVGGEYYVKEGIIDEDYGISDPDEPVVKLVIKTLYWPFPQELLQNLYFRIIEVVRHELEHFGENQGNYTKWKKDQKNYKKPTDTSGNNPFSFPLDKHKAVTRYFVQDNEANAFIRGLMMRAKKTRTPFTQVLEQRLDEFRPQYQSYGIDNTEVENELNQIRTKWLEVAKSKYPTLM